MQVLRHVLIKEVEKHYRYTTILLSLSATKNIGFRQWELFSFNTRDLLVLKL